MAENSNTHIETTQTLQKFIMDRNETLSDGKSVSYHRNGMFQTAKNTEVFATNEPANLECIKLPGTEYFGSVKLSGNNRHLVFTGDNKDFSEIGIADLSDCTYQKVTSSKCLGFRTHYNPITGSVRLNNDGQEEVFFVDGNNSDKVINLSKLPYKYFIDPISQCQTKEFTEELDCEALKLNPNLEVPCIEITKGNSGSLPDGVYFLHIAYIIGNERFTDYMSSTLPVQINNKAGNSSMSVTFTNLDRDFAKYQVILTGVVEGITTHIKIGEYSTSQSTISITDWVNEEYSLPLPSSEIVVRKAVYDNSGIIVNNSETLFRADVKKDKPINYQIQAYDIKAEYIVKQVPLNYYKVNGEDISYFRNEIYRLVIRWHRTNGEISEHSLIPTIAKAFDTAPASGADKFEKEAKYNYEVYNTAGKLIKTPNADIIGYGDTGFWQSTEKFPDDIEVFGERACTYLSDHMMPDEEKVPRFEVIDGEVFVNILGLRFNNIEHPKDENGEYIKDISHYEILRADRDFNNSRVLARGITTNMGGYDNSRKKPVLYTNFPFNDTRPNTFLSKTQTEKKGGIEKKFNPLDKFYQDKFSFYTPFGSYFGRESLAGSYMNVESEERGTATGYFEEPYKHPKYKLLTNFTLLVSAITGLGEALYIQMGKEKTIKGTPATLTTGKATVPPSVEVTQPIPGPLGKDVHVETEDSIYSFPNWGEFINTIKAGTAGGPLKIAGRSLLMLLRTAVATFGTILIASEFAENLIRTIQNFSAYTQYARQYNSECFYLEQRKVQRGNKRRKMKSQPFYMNNGIHTAGKFQINNGGRNSTIFLETEKTLPLLSGDDSRKTMSDFGIESTTYVKELVSNSSVYYVSMMKYNPNQYGSIEGFKPVKIHTCPIKVELKVENKVATKYTSPNLFGGDCIIAEQTHINKAPLFKQTLDDTNYPNGTPYDYRLYNNIGFARFWIDTTEYNTGNLMNIFGKATPTTQKLPNQKYNLDLKNKKKNEWVEKDQVFYTSVNGVIRYIAEVPYNISFREDTQEGEGSNLYMPHFSDEQQDLSYIFRSDLQVKLENFKLNPSYKFLSQIYTYSKQITKLQITDERESNTILYSLPNSSDIGNLDTGGWRYFLPLNRFSFDRRDFGQLTGVHSMDQDRVLFLFSQASPYISPGRSVLELKNQNVVIGDSGIFAQAPREVMHTSVAYGSNHDRYAFASTQFGPFYVSEFQGKLFNFSDNLKEVSREGWHKWAAQFIPLQLKKQFPKWELNHNPVNGVGYQIVFDNIYETVYFCKKDFYALDNVTLNTKTQKFEYNGMEIELGDPLYFEDCSLTLSYNPALEGFQSFHDWHPDAVIQEERHFSTVKKQTIWKHNDRVDLFNNFYGDDYTYQLAVTQSTGQNVTWLQSIEYIQEAYKYKTSELDRYLIKNETFDWSIISNAEQLSGLLKLNDATNVRYEHEMFPRYVGNHHVEIPYNKVENKFRFNMFYDYIINRDSDKQPFITKRNGYDTIINQPAISFQIERPPRFRFYWHTAWFSREKSGSTQFITKFINFKLNNSER